MKTAFFLIAMLLVCTPFGATASDFGPMFAGASTMGLAEDPSTDENFARLLQDIAPAAGGETQAQQTTSDSRYIINTTGTVEIRPGQISHGITRSPVQHFEGEN